MKKFAVATALTRVRRGPHGPLIEIQVVLTFIPADSRERAVEQVLDEGLWDELEAGWQVQTTEVDELPGGEA